MDTIRFFLKLFHLLSIIHLISGQGAPEPQHTFWGYNIFNDASELKEWTTYNSEYCTGCQGFKIRIWGNGGYIYKTASVNTMGYDHITINFTLQSSSSNPLETGEYAEVQYNLDKQTNNWQTLQSYDQNDMTPNITDTIELRNGKNNVGVRIRFRNTGSSSTSDAFYIGGAVWLTGTIITDDPTIYPSNSPSVHQSHKPTLTPSNQPTNNPSTQPTNHPTQLSNLPTNPTFNLTYNTSFLPSINPTLTPTNNPTSQPTNNPSTQPTYHPTQPSKSPTENPTLDIIINMDTTMIRDSMENVKSTYLTSERGINSQSLDHNKTQPMTIIILTVICVLIIFISFCVRYLRKTTKIKKNNAFDYTELIDFTPENAIDNHSLIDDDIDIDDIENVLKENPINGGPSFVEDTQKNINKNKKQYVKDWNTNELLNWILQIENGTYIKYKQTLYSALNENQINGKNIKDINEINLKYFGINILSDRKHLMKHINNLISSQLYQRQIEGQNENNDNHHNVNDVINMINHTYGNENKDNDII
eukprot:354267_1